MANYLLKTSGLINNDFGWSYAHHATSASSEATLNSAFSDAAVALWDTGVNPLKAMVSANIEMTQTEVITLGANWRYVTGSITSHAVVGTNASGSLAWSDATLITTRSANRQKSGHGRFFLPAFAKDQVANNALLPAVVTAVEAAFAAYFNSLGTAGANLVLVNMKALKDGTPPFRTLPIVRFEVVDKIAHQRRRVSKQIPERTGSVVP